MFARTWASAKFPYFNAMTYALAPVPTRDPRVFPQDPEGKPLAFIGVSRHGHLLFHPDVITQLEPETLGFILVHEVQHLLRDHAALADRLIPADSSAGAEQVKLHRGLLNIAEDFCINSDISAATGSRMDIGMYPDMFDLPEGLDAVAYYRRLVDLYNNGDEKLNKMFGDGSNPQCGSGAGNGSSAEDEITGAGEGSSSGDGGADGKQRSGGMSPMRMEIVKRKVANDIGAAAALGKSCGVSPGMLEWANEFLAPAVVPWQTILRRVVSNTYTRVTNGMKDYNWQRQSRRQASVGFGGGKPRLPRMVGYEPTVWVVLDTSGSMWDDSIMGQAIGEVAGIISGLRLQNLTFVSGDAGIGDVVNGVRSFNDIKARIVGGGGTDFRPPFELAMSVHKDYRPDMLVYVTDGYGPAPEAPPPFATIWCLIGSDSVPASWGTVIKVPVNRGGSEEDV